MNRLLYHVLARVRLCMYVSDSACWAGELGAMYSVGLPGPSPGGPFSWWLFLLLAFSTGGTFSWWLCLLVAFSPGGPFSWSRFAPHTTGSLFDFGRAAP